MARLAGDRRRARAGRGQVSPRRRRARDRQDADAAELRALAGGTVTWLEGHCLSYGGLRGWPFIEVLRRWLGVEVGDAEVASGQALAPGSARSSESSGRGAARARAHAAANLDEAGAEHRRGRPRRTRLGRGAGRSQPVVLAIDDVHWADASSRELAEALLELTDRAPVAGRDSRCAPRPRARAAAAHARARRVLASGRRAAARPAPAARLRAGCSTRSSRGCSRRRARADRRARGGQPALSRGADARARRGRGRRAAAPDVDDHIRPSLGVPPALENLLVARIDRLPGPEGLAQVAAASVVSSRWRRLEHVARRPGRRESAGLLRAEIVRELRRYPCFECTFRHGLLQEAALSTLTPRGRRELYARAARRPRSCRGHPGRPPRAARALPRAGGNCRTALEYIERARGGKAQGLAVEPPVLRVDELVENDRSRTAPRILRVTRTEPGC